MEVYIDIVVIKIREASQIFQNSRERVGTHTSSYG